MLTRSERGYFVVGQIKQRLDGVVSFARQFRLENESKPTTTYNNNNNNNNNAALDDLLASKFIYSNVKDEYEVDNQTIVKEKLMVAGARPLHLV